MCAWCCGKHEKIASRDKALSGTSMHLTVICHVEWLSFHANTFSYFCHQFLTFSSLKWRMMTTFKIQFIFSARDFQYCFRYYVISFIAFMVWTWKFNEKVENESRKQHFAYYNLAGEKKDEEIRQRLMCGWALMWFINYVNQDILFVSFHFMYFFLNRH